MCVYWLVLYVCFLPQMLTNLIYHPPSESQQSLSTAPLAVHKQVGGQTGLVMSYICHLEH